MKFRKYRNFQIATQMYIGFATMILFVILLGVISSRQTDILQNQTEIFYNHPFQVRRALGYLNADILKMRLGTRDLMLADSEQEIYDALKLIETSAHDAELQFKTLREHYLGPQSDVTAAYNAFITWNVARQENIKRVLDGDIQAVKDNIKPDGRIGKYREDMLNKIDVIDKFSFNKSNQIYEYSEQLNTTINTQMVFIVFIFLIISIIISYYLLRNIRRPIIELTDVTTRFQNGDLDARSSVFSKNEFSILSEAFNSLAEQIQQNLILNKMETSLAASMLKEEDAHRFFQSLLPLLSSYTNSQMVAVYLLSDDKKRFEHFESVGTSDTAKISFDANSYEGEFGQVLLSRKMESIKNIPLDTRFVFNTVSGTFVPREIITIPILAGDEIVAIISLASVRKYNKEATLLIENVYDTLNARIEGVLTYQQLKHFSTILEKQKEELAKAGTYNRCLIEASIDPLVTIGPDGKITDVNQSTEDITGLSRKELIGTDFANYFTDPQKAKEGYQQVFRDGMVHDYELELRHIHGKVTPVLYNATVYKDETGKVIGVFAAARDVSESKRIEKELLRLNEDLNQRSEKLQMANSELQLQKQELDAQSTELAQQNAELEIQKNQLNEANRLKTNFLSNMSHELRTPLNSVIALSGVLNRRLVKLIPEEEYSYLSVIERNGKHLLSLINDILDISRIEAGREEIEIGGFDMNRLLADVVVMIKPQADEKKIELIHKNENTHQLLRSDMDKCRHILQNLIGNAVKFTDKGKVEVETMQKGNSIKVIVTDTGVGISEKHIDHIFDEFRQADGSTSRRYGGTGLGLAIAKKYANLLGGTIAVSSVLDKGSTFILTLPLQYAAENKIAQERVYESTASIANQAVDTLHAKGKTILVVEDSEPAVIQIKDFLEESGYQVLTAKNGADAFQIISNIVPDAMILDLMMPDMDGFEVLKTLREAEKTAHVPVLILTAKHITKDELKFLKRNNIHQLIQKGDVNRAELLNAVRSMITLSVETISETENVPLPTPNEINGKPQILIVEDNIDNMITVKAVLGDAFIVFEANNGVEGVKMAKKHKPDLILMDIALPEMDGVEAFKKIRNNGQLAHIPILALTASAMTNDRETILAYGFDGYLVKPIDEKVFFKTINQVLYGK